jgi:hypothetical protein
MPINSLLNALSLTLKQVITPIKSATPYFQQSSRSANFGTHALSVRRHRQYHRRLPYAAARQKNGEDDFIE